MNSDQGVQKELLYVNELVLINMKKTKLMMTDTRLVRRSGRWPCSVCKKGVSSNFVFCVFCEH